MAFVAAPEHRQSAASERRSEMNVRLNAMRKVSDFHTRVVSQLAKTWMEKDGDQNGWTQECEATFHTKVAAFAEDLVRDLRRGA